MTWKLHKFGCISDHFCVLQNTDMYIYIYISEQITWNLYELVACQIMFVSYKIMIYIYNFRTNYMKFVWIGCMSGHFCIFKYHDVYIYIYIYLIFKPNDMKCVWIGYGCMSENLCMINNHDI